MELSGNARSLWKGKGALATLVALLIAIGLAFAVNPATSGKAWADETIESTIAVANTPSTELEPGKQYVFMCESGSTYYAMMADSSYGYYTYTNSLNSSTLESVTADSENNRYIVDFDDSSSAANSIWTATAEDGTDGYKLSANNKYLKKSGENLYLKDGDSDASSMTYKDGWLSAAEKDSTLKVIRYYTSYRYFYGNSSSYYPIAEAYEVISTSGLNTTEYNLTVADGFEKNTDTSTYSDTNGNSFVLKVGESVADKATRKSTVTVEAVKTGGHYVLRSIDTTSSAKVSDVTDGKYATFTMPGEDVTITVTFAKQYSVTFETDGATKYGTINPKLVYDGETASRPSSDPSREGQIFGGWYIDSNNNQKADAEEEEFDFTTKVHTDYALVAKWEDPITTIQNAKDWEKFKSTVENGFNYKGMTVTLGTDLTGDEKVTSGVGEYTLNTYTFAGTFDGKGKTVELGLTTGGSYGLGLFGVLAPDSGVTVVIKNVVTIGSVNGDSSSVYGVGGIVGYTDGKGNVSLENVGNSANITGCPESSSYSSSYIGGLVGNVNQTGKLSISSSYNSGAVVANGSKSAGGLIGYTEGNYNGAPSDITIKACYNRGDVSVKTDSTSFSAGGLIGYVGEYSSYYSSSSYQAPVNISDSYNASNVGIASDSAVATASSAYAGQVIGKNASTNKGTISSTFYDSKLIGGDKEVGNGAAVSATGVDTTVLKSLASGGGAANLAAATVVLDKKVYFAFNPVTDDYPALCWETRAGEKRSTGHDINAERTEGGTYQVLVEGVEVSAAAKGAMVNVSASPDDGYVLDSVSIKKESSDDFTKLEGTTFEMPDEKVTVKVDFKQLGAVEGTIAVSKSPSTSLVPGKVYVFIATKNDKNWAMLSTQSAQVSQYLAAAAVEESAHSDSALMILDYDDDVAAASSIWSVRSESGNTYLSQNGKDLYAETYATNLSDSNASALSYNTDYNGWNSSNINYAYAVMCYDTSGYYKFETSGGSYGGAAAQAYEVKKVNGLNTAEYTLIMPKNATANDDGSYSIEGGTFSVNTGGKSLDKLNKRSPITVTATPDSEQGYVLKSVTAEPAAVTLDENTATFKMPGANTTLDVVFKKQWTVTFSSNGGEPKEIANASVFDGEKVTLPSVSSEDKLFGGWYVDQNDSGEIDDGEVPFESDAVVNSNLSLIAKWVNPPTEIANAADWQNFKAAIESGIEDYDGKTVTLTSDIEVTDGVSNVSSGYDAKTFKGTFDGNDKTINLKLATSKGVVNVGLFGILVPEEEETVTIKNLHLTGSVSAPKLYQKGVGSVLGCVGYSYATAAGTVVLENVGNDATVTACISGESSDDGSSLFIGGLVGEVDKGTLELRNCCNHGQVSSDLGYNIGGLVGGVVTNGCIGTLANCYNTGDVILAKSGPVYSTAVRSLGGLVGKAGDPQSSAAVTLNVNGCFNASDVGYVTSDKKIVAPSNTTYDRWGQIIGCEYSSNKTGSSSAVFFDSARVSGDKSATVAVSSSVVSSASKIAATGVESSVLRALSSADNSPVKALADAKNDENAAFYRASRTYPALSWESTPAAKVASYTKADSLTYNGAEQTGVKAVDGCEVENGTGTNADNYTSTITVSDGYEWEDATWDETTVPWSIGKAKLTATYKSESCPVGETPLYAVEVTGFQGSDTAATLAESGYKPPTVSASETLEANKEYELTPTGGEPTDNYEFDYKSGKLTVTESGTNRKISKPSAHTNLVYTGAEQTGVDDPADNSGYTLTGNKATNAGIYTATATLKDGFEWLDETGNATAEASIPYEIAKAELQATYKDEEVAWNDSPALEVVVTGFVSGETADNAAGYVAPKVKAPSTLEIGEHSLTPENGNATNYRFTYVSGTLTVTEAKIAVPSAKDGLVYTGKSLTGVDSADGYELAGETGTGAGNYSATLTLKDGYVWKDRDGSAASDPAKVQWSIAPATLTAKADDQTIAYDGRPDAAKVTVTGFVNNESPTMLSGYVAPTVIIPEDYKPGQTYTLIPSGGEPTRNYKFVYQNGTLTVGAAPTPEQPTAVDKPTAKSLTYTGAEQTGVEDATGYTVTGNKQTYAGSYTATAKLAKGYVWKGATGDAATADASIPWSIAQATLTATYASETIEANGTPALKVNVTGFVNGENANNAKDYKAPTVSKPATIVAGKTYSLTPTGGSAANYSFKYVAGNLVVKADDTTSTTPGTSTPGASATTPGTSTTTPGKTTAPTTAAAKTQTITTSKAGYTVKATAKAFKLGAKASGGGKLTYKSSRPAVAKVDANGKVKPVGAGKATITIKAAATTGYKAATKTVTVKVTRAKQKISGKAKVSKSITPSKKTGKVAKKTTIVKLGKGKTATTYKAKMSKKAKKYITVSKKGKVILKKGTPSGTYKVKVTVTAKKTAKYSKKTKTVNITVKVKNAKVKAASTSLTPAVL